MRLALNCSCLKKQPLVAISAKNYRQPLRIRIETWTEFLTAELNRDEDIAYLVPYTGIGGRVRSVNRAKPKLAVELRFSNDGDGCEIISSGKDETTKIFQAELVCEVQESHASESDLEWFLNEVKCPAVIVEPCRLDDLASMCFYRRPIVESMAKTIKEWLRYEGETCTASRNLRESITS